MTALTLLKNARVYDPAARGLCDVVVANAHIVAVGPNAAASIDGKSDMVMTVDVQGARLLPGLIDAHVHVTGGGGESGPQTRVPPIVLTHLTRAGVTSCIGLLGTDSTTRTIRDLLGRTLGLRREGLSAWCYTGSYEVPVKTLTGSIRDDIVFIDPIIGVGELAISDHRSSQPTFEELARIAADCHVAGMMSGKAGLLHLHLGDGKRGLSMINRLLDETELPARTFHPTHCNRQRWLFDDAMKLAERGCTIDVTAFDPEDDGISVEDCIERWLDSDLPNDKLTVSSDGAGCLPVFDRDGVLLEMDIGRPETLSAAIKALLERGRALEDIAPFFTANVAQLFRLDGKGHVAAGHSADLVVLDDDGAVRDVMARGKFVVEAGVATHTGVFEGRAAN